MRAAIIENGVVTNVILVAEAGFLGSVPCDDAVAPGWTYNGTVFSPPEAGPQPEGPPPAPLLYAVGLFSVADGDITGIDVASKIAAALWLNVGLYYVFFAETLPDARYIARAHTDQDDIRMRVIEKDCDYLVLTAADASSAPVDPGEFSLEIIRVI